MEPGRPSGYDITSPVVAEPREVSLPEICWTVPLDGVSVVAQERRAENSCISERAGLRFCVASFGSQGRQLTCAARASDCRSMRQPSRHAEDALTRNTLQLAPTPALIREPKPRRCGDRRNRDQQADKAERRGDIISRRAAIYMRDAIRRRRGQRKPLQARRQWQQRKPDRPCVQRRRELHQAEVFCR